MVIYIYLHLHIDYIKDRDEEGRGEKKSGCWSLAYILGSPAAAAAAAPAAPRGPCEVFYIVFLQGGLLYYI